MEIERVPAADVRVGDVITISARPGWWSISAVQRSQSNGVTFHLVSIDDEHHDQLHIPADDFVRRTDPAGVHHVKEFLGLSVDDARALSGALGWAFRHEAQGFGMTDDLVRSRITVRTDDHGIVIAAEMG